MLMTPEAENLENIIYTLLVPPPGQLPRLFAELEKIERHGKILPLGLAVWQLDREATNSVDPRGTPVVWVQPFLTGERAARALIQARNDFGKDFGKNHQAKFN